MDRHAERWEEDRNRWYPNCRSDCESSHDHNDMNTYDCKGICCERCLEAAATTTVGTRYWAFLLIYTFTQCRFRSWNVYICCSCLIKEILSSEWQCSLLLTRETIRPASILLCGSFPPALLSLSLFFGACNVTLSNGAERLVTQCKMKMHRSGEGLVVRRVRWQIEVQIVWVDWFVNRCGQGLCAGV